MIVFDLPRQLTAIKLATYSTSGDTVIFSGDETSVANDISGCGVIVTSNDLGRDVSTPCVNQIKVIIAITSEIAYFFDTLKPTGCNGAERRIKC